MASTVNDLERAELMLSLGMNDEGEALTPEERTEIQAFVDANKSPVSLDLPGDEDFRDGSLTKPAAPAAQPVGVPDIQAMIQQAVAQAVGGINPGGGGVPQSFEDMLSRIDPRDSDASLAMFQWLCDNGRIQMVGTLNGGGYLLHYQEPKGSSKEGYTPGGTQGGRMVDNAVAKAKESGAKPKQMGMCSKCMSAVERLEDGTVVDDTQNPTCQAGGTHDFHA